MVCGLHEMFPHGDTAGTALQVSMEDEESGALTMNFLAFSITRTDRSAEVLIHRAPLCADDENLTEVLRRKFAALGFEMEEGGMTRGTLCIA